MNNHTLEEDEAVEFILKILRGASEPLKTSDLQVKIKNNQVRCPDTMVILLNRLRTQGLIQGQHSKEHRGWIWWIEN